MLRKTLHEMWFDMKKTAYFVLVLIAMALKATSEGIMNHFFNGIKL